jgi:hypothetical protein
MYFFGQEYWCKSHFRKIVLPFSTNPNFYTTLTSLINKLINTTPNDAPHTTLINNWIDINARKWWINFTIWLNFLVSSYFTKLLKKCLWNWHQGWATFLAFWATRKAGKVYADQLCKNKVLKDQNYPLKGGYKANISDLGYIKVSGELHEALGPDVAQIWNRLIFFIRLFKVAQFIRFIFWYFLLVLIFSLSYSYFIIVGNKK